MSRDEVTYVADMVEACDRVMEYTVGLNAASFRGDRKRSTPSFATSRFSARQPSVSLTGSAPKRPTFRGARSPACATC